MYAPIVIPTLNRFDHLKQCIKSLSQCHLADKSDLIIAIDYPCKDSHWEGYSKICDYTLSISGFARVTIVKREENYGAIRNFFALISSTFNQYDRLIFTEDDNIFAPDFLSFVNTGLNTYIDRADVFSISGSKSLIPIPAWYTDKAYLHTAFSAWGVGLWKDKWEKVTWDTESLKTIYHEKETHRYIKKYHKRHIPLFERVVNTGYLAADACLFLYMKHNGWHSLFPVVSRVRNLGHDGSGVHGGISELYYNQEIYTGAQTVSLPPDLVYSDRLARYILNKSRSRTSLIQVIKPYIPAILRHYRRMLIKLV